MCQAPLQALDSPPSEVGTIIIPMSQAGRRGPREVKSVARVTQPGLQPCSLIPESEFSAGLYCFFDKRMNECINEALGVRDSRAPLLLRALQSAPPIAVPLPKVRHTSGWAPVGRETGRETVVGGHVWLWLGQRGKVGLKLGGGGFHSSQRSRNLPGSEQAPTVPALIKPHSCPQPGSLSQGQAWSP